MRRVTELMTAIITRAVQGTERHAPTAREVRVARILMQVWLSSLNGWVCGVDGPIASTKTSRPPRTCSSGSDRAAFTRSEVMRNQPRSE